MRLHLKAGINFPRADCGRRPAADEGGAQCLSAPPASPNCRYLGVGAGVGRSELGYCGLNVDEFLNR